MHARATTAATWQQHLDFVLPRKQTLRADEIAEAAGLDERTVLRAFTGPAIDKKTGKVVRPWLLGFEFNAGNGQRFTKRIPRDAAFLWLAACANYEPADFLCQLCDVLARRSPHELVELQARITEIIKTKQS